MTTSTPPWLVAPREPEALPLTIRPEPTVYADAVMFGALTAIRRL
jgi:hypothetical protein